MNLDMTTIEAINSELQSIDREAINQQSIQGVWDLGVKLSGWISYTGEQQALAKRIWRASQKKAYETFAFSTAANGLDFTPTKAAKTAGVQMLKEYINSCAGEHEANHEQIERTNRALTHTLDFVRSICSYMNSELKASTANQFVR